MTEDRLTLLALEAFHDERREREFRGCTVSEQEQMRAAVRAVLDNRPLLDHPHAL